MIHSHIPSCIAALIRLLFTSCSNPMKELEKMNIPVNGDGLVLSAEKGNVTAIDLLVKVEISVKTLSSKGLTALRLRFEENSSRPPSTSPFDLT